MGYMDVTVRWLDDKAWKEAGLADNEGGQFDGAGATISVRLAEGQHDIHLREILLHEVLHACYYVSGISVNDDPRVVPDIEEFTVARVSPVLLEILRDNPALSKFLES
jgi:hypothetical protein